MLSLIPQKAGPCTQLIDLSLEESCFSVILRDGQDVRLEVPFARRREIENKATGDVH
jgi:hypothetical protein